MNYIVNILKDYGVEEKDTGYLSYILFAILTLFICIITNLIIKKIVLKLLTKIIQNNRIRWDNILLDHKVFTRMADIIPGIIVFILAPAFEEGTNFIRRGATVYILAVLLFVINSLLDAINEIYKFYPISKVRPIKGLLSVAKIIIFIVIGIVIVGTLMDQNPLLLLSGIGALAAVFSFVFKDSILGFIAGIQLTSNDMLRIGDWIEMPKYGADGDVIDITLNTVKVQNFDKTIVTIPAYSMISDSFKNWRGMKEYGGRRIKRSINIDVNSIVFCTTEMLEKYKKIDYLKDYILEKEKEIAEFNRRHETNEEELLINGRHLTNVGTFRVYIQAYLKNNQSLQKNTMQLVRQLPPTENGLPIEVYAFTNSTDWVAYEIIQADLFDHIFSVAGEFGLRIFQNPTGYDMKQISINK